MSKKIDCVLIGHNQVCFEKHEDFLKSMGEDTLRYQDLNRNFLRFNNKVLTASDTYNLLCCNNINTPIKQAETFSAGIAYLGTFLNRRGYTFDYVNLFQEEKEYLREILCNNEVLTVGILTTYYVVHDPIIEIIDFIKKHNPNAKILVGGPFISNKVRSFDNRTLNYFFEIINADFYINSSQGELALVNIIDSIKSNKPFKNISNIYFKSKDGYNETPINKENNKLAENIVQWELFSDRIPPFVNIRTSISCPFNCSFCGYPEHAGKYQVLDASLIENELKSLAKIETIKSIFFIDDTLNFPQKRFMDILKMLYRNRFPFKWNAYIRCQFLDEEVVKLMKDTGCESVFLGIESGDDRILKNMNKNSNTTKYLKGIQLLKKYGIQTFGSFIIGFPGETKESVKNTVNFIKNSGLDFYRTQLWYCEQITPIWNQREKYSLKGSSFEWEHETMNSVEASNYVEAIILDIENPVRIPQYYFDFENVMQLTHKGFSLDQVKQFLTYFNEGIKQKISLTSNEISTDVFEKISGLSQ